MSKPASLKKTTREKIFDVVLKTFEELIGHPATDKAKKRIARKSRKLSSTIINLLKKESRKQAKLVKASQSKEKKTTEKKVKKSVNNG